MFSSVGTFEFCIERDAIFYISLPDLFRSAIFLRRKACGLALCFVELLYGNTDLVSILILSKYFIYNFLNEKHHMNVKISVIYLHQWNYVVIFHSVDTQISETRHFAFSRFPIINSFYKNVQFFSIKNKK